MEKGVILAKNIEMNVQGSDGSYEVLYPASVSDMIQLSQEMLTNLGLSSGTLDTALITTVIPSVVPVGCMFWYCNQNPPVGFLKCDGSNISRTNYNQLFAVIGTTFGSGNGSTTFTLPNLLAKFVRGAGSSGGYSASFGLTEDASAIQRNITGIADTGGYYPNKLMASVLSPDKTVAFTNSVSTGWIANSGIRGADGSNCYVRPYNISLTPIIKY